MSIESQYDVLAPKAWTHDTQMHACDALGSPEGEDAHHSIAPIDLAVSSTNRSRAAFSGESLGPFDGRALKDNDNTLKSRSYPSSEQDTPALLIP